MARWQLIVEGVPIVVLTLLWFSRVIGRAWRKRKSMINQKESEQFAAAATAVSRLTQSNAAKDVRIAELETKLTADNALTNDLKKQLVDAQASGDRTDLDEALTNLVGQLGAIGVAPPPSPAAVDPGAAPTPPAAA